MSIFLVLFILLCIGAAVFLVNRFIPAGAYMIAFNVIAALATIWWLGGPDVFGLWSGSLGHMHGR